MAAGGTIRRRFIGTLAERVQARYRTGAEEARMGRMSVA
jgi:hypothetical protein